MSKPSLNLRYLGTNHEVEVHYDGQLVTHTTTDAKGARTHLISVRGGPHQLNTLHKLDVQVLQGPCAIKVNGGGKKNLKTAGKLSIPPGAAFDIEASNGCVLTCTPKPGPGFGGGGRENGALD
ncbi:MAG TPA: hypothetical protein VGD81_11050 [Opitutaceae bacterium]